MLAAPSFFNFFPDFCLRPSSNLSPTPLSLQAEAASRKRPRDAEATFDYESVKDLSAATPNPKLRRGANKDKQQPPQKKGGAAAAGKGKKVAARAKATPSPRSSRTVVSSASGQKKRARPTRGTQVEEEEEEEEEEEDNTQTVEDDDEEEEEVKFAAGSRVQVSERVTSSSKATDHAGKCGDVVSRSRTWVTVRIDGETDPVALRPKELTPWKDVAKGPGGGMGGTSPSTARTSNSHERTNTPCSGQE